MVPGWSRREDFWILPPQPAPGSKRCLQSRSGEPSAYFTAFFAKHMLLGMVEEVNYFLLASSGPFGPLLARSGDPGKDASFYNNPMVMTCATVNALTLL